MEQQNPDIALGVEFFTKPVEQLAESREKGRPIYKDEEYVRITFPADSKRELVAPAHEMHYVPHAKEQMTYAQRFQGSYEAFAESCEDFIAGTPLVALGGQLTEARIAELKALKINTIEQLAGLPDAARKRIGMGALELQEKAKSFLETAGDVAKTTALENELAELRAQIAGMQNTPSEKTHAPDPFEGLEDDDLKNLIRDSGGEVPRGRASRETLVDALNAIAAEKEAA